MATTEEFLIALGLDQASVQKVIDQINALKGQADTQVDVTINTNAAQAANEVASAAQSMATIADESMAQFEDGIRDVEAGLQEMQKTLIAISGAAALFAGFGFAQAAEESTNLARANVILGQSTEELAGTQAQLRAVADEVGLTYTEVSAALFDVASAGLQGQEAIDAVTAAARVAAPTTATVAESFNALATAGVNFGLSFEEAGDKLVKIADLTRGSLTDVANAVALVGPTAAQAGLELEQLGGAFAAITQSGQTGEQAATLLFNSVISFISPAKEAREALEGIGIATGGAAFESQTLADKIQILTQAAADGRIEIGQVFNQRAFRGISALIQNAEYMGDAIEGIGDAAGRTQEGLDAFFQQSGPQLKLLRTAVVNLATAIGADLLNTLQPLIEGTIAFVKNNRQLLTLLVKLSLVLGGLAAAWLTYRIVASQVAAAMKVVTGLSKALTAVLTFEGASLKANVKAWYAKLTAEQAAGTSPVIKLLRSTVALLGTETGVIYTNTKAWVVNIASRAWEGFKTWIVGLYRAISGFIAETVAVNASTAAHERRNVVLATGGRLWAKLKGILTQNVAQMSLASAGAAALGAAIAGWQIGKAINNFFELEKATERYVKGTATLGDQIKQAFIAVAIPPLGLYIEYQRRSAQETLRQANTLTELQKKMLEAEGTMDTFNKYLEKGANVAQAYSIALGGIATEAKFLENLRDANKASVEDLQRLAALQARLNRLADESNAKREKAVRLQKLLQNGAQIIKQTQEAWVSILGRVETAYAKLQTGGLSGVLEGAKQFEADFNVILQRFQVFNANLAALQTQASRTDLSAKELEQFKLDIEKAAGDVAQAYGTLTKAIAVERDNILRLGREYVADLRTAAQDEIDAYRSAAEDVIKIEQNKLDELQKVYDKLVDARRKSTEAVERFAQRLEAAQLRRRDPALAEAVQLEKDFNNAIAGGISSTEQAARVVGLLRTELERLAGPTAEEVRLQEELARIQKELGTADARDDNQQRRSQLLERQKKIQDELATAEQKRAEREKQAVTILDRATKAAEASVEAFKQRDQAILDLKKQIETADKNIEAVEARIAAKEAEINSKLQDRIKATEKFIQLQLKVLDNAEKYAKAAASASQEVGRAQITPEVQQQALEARGQYLESLEEARGATQVALPGAEQISKEIDAVGQSAKQVADFINNVKDEFAQVNVEVAKNGQVIIPAAQEVVTTFQGLQTAFEPSQNALADMLQATERFAPAVTTFGEKVVSTMTQQKRTLDKATAEIDVLKVRVDRLSQTGGGANGLPK